MPMVAISSSIPPKGGWEGSTFLTWFVFVQLGVVDGTLLRKGHVVVCPSLMRGQWNSWASWRSWTGTEGTIKMCVNDLGIFPIILESPLGVTNWTWCTTCTSSEWPNPEHQDSNQALLDESPLGPDLGWWWHFVLTWMTGTTIWLNFKFQHYMVSLGLQWIFMHLCFLLFVHQWLACFLLYNLLYQCGTRGHPGGTGQVQRVQWRWAQMILEIFLACLTMQTSAKFHSWC